jgi:hypothetical protein
MMLIKKLISFVFQKTLKNEKPENKKFKSWKISPENNW